MRRALRATLSLVKAWRLQVEVEPWPEGGYIARAPALQGCWVVSATIEQAIKDIQDGIEMSISSRIKHGEALPPGLEELPSDGDKLRFELAVAVA